MSPWKFVEGFAQNISCNPAQATVPGTVGRLDERGLLPHQQKRLDLVGETVHPFSMNARLERKCNVTTSCLLKTLALTT